MASEIRVDKINSLSGVGTVTLSPTGVDIAGITTAATLRATTGIVTSLTAGSLTSLGAVSGTTGTFSGAVSGTTGTFSGAVSGTTGTFSAAVSGTTGTFTGAVTLADGVSNGLKIGAGEDLVLQHNGTNSFIDNNTGDLYIQTTGSGDDILIESADDITLKVAGSETAIQATGDGAVELYHNNEKKLYTATNGTVISSEGDTTLGVYGGSGGSGYGQLYLNGSGTSNNYVQSDNGLVMWINGANRAKFETDGTFIVQDGNINIQTSGHGISFAATGEGSNTSGESELFDDYEEGSCTILIHDAVGSNISVTGGNHKYTKIGNRVFVEGQFTFAESGSKNGGLMQLYQLPYAPAQVSPAAGNYWYDGPSDATDVTGLVYVHTNGTCYLKQSTTQGQNSNNKYLTFNEISANGGRILFVSFTYIT